MRKIILFGLGLFLLTNVSKVMALTPPCQNLWWYDDANRVCSQKSFCGSYMYQGLMTFGNLSDCKSSLGIKDTITTEASCGGVTMTGERSVTVNNDIRSATSVWETVEDTKTRQKVLISWYSGTGIGSIKLSEDNLYFGSIRRGDGYVEKLPVVSDGRMYAVKAYTAPFTEGIPVFMSSNLLASSYFSFNCPTAPTPTAVCKNLWWFDSSSSVCNQKSFCGTYMYQGLRTFSTLTECQKALKTNCSLKRCGDANCDGKINIQDLMIWMNERNSNRKTADFNNDGRVDSKDYAILKNSLIYGCGKITPTPRISTIPTRVPTVVPAYNCDMLYKLNLGSTQNYFDMCASNKYAKVCFNKYTGVYQGCGTAERDDCTVYNMNADKNIRCDSKLASVTPTPRVPTVTPVRSVNWKTQWANFSATDFQIQVADGTMNGKTFRVNPSKPCNMTTGEMVCVHSNPPSLTSSGLNYMTLEVQWYEDDIEMRMFIYLYSDGKRWWSNEIRVYNGQAQPNTDWVYFKGKFFDTAIGQSFNQTSQFSLSAADPKNNNSPVTLRFSNLRFEAFKDYFKVIPTPLPTTLCRGGYYGGTYGPACGDSGFDLYNYYLKFSCADNTPGVVGDTSQKTCYNKNDLVNMAEKFCSTHSVCSYPTPTPVKICTTDKDCPSGQICYQPPMPTCPSGAMCVQSMPVKYCKTVAMTVTPTPVVSTKCQSLMATQQKYFEICRQGGFSRICFNKNTNEYQGCFREDRDDCTVYNTNAAVNVGCVVSNPVITPTSRPTSRPTTMLTPKPTIRGVCTVSNGDADKDGKITIKDYSIWKYEYSSGKIGRSDFNCNKVVDLNDYTIWKRAFLEARNLMVTTNN